MGNMATLHSHILEMNPIYKHFKPPHYPFIIDMQKQMTGSRSPFIVPKCKITLSFYLSYCYGVKLEHDTWPATISTCFLNIHLVSLVMLITICTSCLYPNYKVGLQCWMLVKFVTEHIVYNYIDWEVTSSSMHKEHCHWDCLHTTMDMGVIHSGN